MPFISFGEDGNPGRVTVVNDGTAESFPLFEVTGGMSLGFILTDLPTGDHIFFDRVVPEGSTIFINPKTGWASINGQSDVSRFIHPSSRPFAIPKGATHQIQFAPLGVVTGTPQLRVRFAPAFW